MRYRTNWETYNPDLDKVKLDQAILFFLHRVNNSLLGKTKLMKLLYYADFDHYEEYDQSITGARYRKLPHGPVPEDAFRAIERLVEQGRIRCRNVELGEQIQDRCEPVEPLDLGVFESHEMDTLSRVAERWAGHSTTQIITATHGEAPWLAVRQNEVIPYHLAYYRNNHGEMGLDDDEIGEADRLPSEDEVLAR